MSRLPQGDAVHVTAAWSSAASRCPASRRSRASSPRTRSSSLEFERGGWHTILGVLGYVGAFMTAIYTFRMIFRAFHGEPCPEARGARARAPLPRARADQPGDRRGRGHRRRLPRPRAPHRRARGADEGRDGRARRARDHRRLPADPGRRRRAAQLPRADVRGLRSSTRQLEPCAGAASGSA